MTTDCNIQIRYINNHCPSLWLSSAQTEFTIIVEPSKHISATSPDYTFIVEVNSTNLERTNDTDDNKVIVGIALKVEVNLTIYGSEQQLLIIDFYIMSSVWLSFSIRYWISKARPQKLLPESHGQWGEGVNENPPYR